jgi:hypothetical protein
MQVKTAEASNAKWIRNSMRAYLEGLNDLNWIVRVIGIQVPAAKETLISLENYGDHKRYRTLLAWFLNQA